MNNILYSNRNVDFDENHESKNILTIVLPIASISLILSSESLIEGLRPNACKTSVNRLRLT
jgi:hypothetical protein